MIVTKLFQWLIAAGVIFTVWIAYVAGYFNIKPQQEYHEIIIALPVYILVSFACFSLAVVGYRVATFNDCVDASKELKEQIEEARQDLEKKGYKFASDWK